MDFSIYISELLYTYDCVIIPQFGGFVANYKPAHIHPVSHKISPPSKQIGFNKNLQQNDGLLANKIAREQQISYAEAVDLITRWRKEIEKQLAENGFFSFEKIGKLTRKSDKTIVFDAYNKENYFPGAYGLTPVVARPVKHETKVTTIARQTKSQNIKWIQRAAAIFIGGMITSYCVFNFDTVSQQTAQLASFFSGKSALYSPGQSAQLHIKPAESREAVIDSSGTTTFLMLNNSKTVIASRIDSTAVSVYAPPLRFHIIAGCFSNQSNAKKLAKKLKKQGFDPKIIRSYKNYYTVILKSFATKEQAKSFLPQTKPLIAHSWVLEWNV